MFARISTTLDATPEQVWEAVQSLETFQYVTRGMLGVTATKDDPNALEKPLLEGQTFTIRMWFFNLIPAWLHTIHVMELNQERRELLTHERGSFITTWNHRICVEPSGDDRTHYTDEIEIKAGVLTVPVVFFAHIFYRYRQSRWRKLALTLK